LTLHHHLSRDDPKWPEFGPGAVGLGWDLALLGLSWRVSGAPLDPSEGMAWMASDDGKRFMTLSSQRWCAAHIAAGADPDDAQAAAARTLAAYTGAG